MIRTMRCSRPSNVHIPGNHIWIASSPDLIHWGRHECLATVRPGMWDSVRVGAGAAPYPYALEDGWRSTTARTNRTVTASARCSWPWTTRVR